MSRQVDNYVASMQFDNSHFEKNVATSMSTLDKLKQSLRLDDASDGMSGLGSAAETVKMKFSAMEVVAVTALANLTNSAINTGKQLINSLSIDQITAGWQKFSDKTTSVATLVAQGNALEDVNDQLDRLNWFTDETSYNFTDMVSNISKFTATGQDLESSVTAMEGIATWAALSGQNASTASRAMYQLSQAMGAGYMRLEDYKSIQNASMDTEEFRQKCLDAGVALGTLQKNSDGTYSSLVDGASGASFGISQFAQNLTKEMWMTSDVMMEVFNTYSGAVEGIYDAAEEKGMLASEIIDEIYSTAEKKGISTDEAIKLLGYDFDSFALKAFEAAQKARTFNDAIDSVKDAVSTGWMNTFEIIFGDAEEATELWTDLANSLWDVFAAGGEARNEMLKGWKELGGRDDLIDSFWNVWEGIASIVTPIKEAFRDIFPPMTAERLAEITAKLKELTAKFKLSDEQAAKLKSTFKGLFAVLDIVWTVFKTLVSGAFKIVDAFGNLASGVLGATGSLGDFLSGIRDSIKETNIFGKVIDGIVGFITNATDKIQEFGKSLKTGVDTSGFSGILGFFKGLWSFVTKVAKAIISTLGDLGSSLAEALGKGDIFEVFNSGALAGILVGIMKMSNGLGNALKDIGSLTDNIIGILDSVRGCFEAYQQQLKAGALLKIAAAIAILAVSLLVLSGIDPDALGSAISAITVLFAELVGSMALMKKIGGGASMFKSGATQMIAMALSVLILAAAMKKLSGLDWEQMSIALVAISALLWELVAVSLVMSKTGTKMVKGSIGLIALAAAIKILASACKDFATMSWVDIGKGLAAIGALLLEISIFQNIAGKAKHVVKTGLSLVLIAASLKIAASALSDLAVIQWNDISKGLTAIGIALLEMTLAMRLMPKGSVFKATGLVIAAASLEIIANVMSKFAGMEWNGIGKGLTAMGGALAELAIGLNLMKGTAKGAAALLVASLALAIIAPVIKKFDNMSWEQIAKGLITMAGAFAIIGVAGLLLKPLIGTILKLSVAFVLFGAGMIGIGAGITLIAFGIGALATALTVGATSIVAALTVIVTGILELVPTIVQIIGKTIVGIATVIGEQAPTLATSCIKLVKSVLQSLAEEAPELTRLIAEILIGVMNSLTEYMPQIIEALLNLLASVFDGLGKALQNLDFGSLRDGINAASGLAALMLAMSVALKIASKIKIKDAVKGALALTTMAIPLAAFVGVLALMNGVEVATKTVIALAALAGACSLMLIPLSLVGSMGLGSALKGVIALTAMAVPMLAFVGVLALMSGVENATNNAIALAALAGACTLMLIPLTVIGAICASGVGAVAIIAGVLALTAMAVPMLAFVGVLALMDNIKNAESNAKLLTNLMTVMGTLLVAVSLVAPMAVVGVAAMSALTLLIGAIGVMAVTVGALMDTFPSLEKFLDKGLPILEKLAGGIGSMIGKFIGSIGEALGDSLVKIGDDIAKFMEKIAKASESAGTINGDAFDGVEKLMGVLLEIGGTSIGTGIMDGISRLFNFGDDSMDTFEKDAVAFFKAMKKIGDEANKVEINPESFDAVITAAERLADLQSHLEPIGGVVTWFKGRDDLGTFGANVASFISSMKVAFAQLKDAEFNTDAMDAVVSAATSLAELQSHLEPIGGVVTWFKGRDDLGTFGANVASFIFSMKIAFAQLNDAKFNTEAMDSVIRASTSLAELQSHLEPIGGVVDWFTGRDDLGTFGINVASFISSMKIAFAQLDGVKFNNEAMDAIISAATSLGNLQSNLDSVGGVVDWFTGRDDLGTFGKNVASFISSMKTALESLDGVTLNEEAMTSVINAASKLADLQSKLEPMGGVVSWFSGRTDLGTFGTNIGLFGDAMGKLREGMGENGITEAVITSITNSGNAIIELQKALPEEHWFDGKMNLSEFSDYITDFAEAMSTFGSKASEIDSGAVTTVISTAYRIKSLIESLVGLDTSGVKEFTGIGTGGIGADGPAYKIAKAMAAYSDEVAGIDTNAVSVSATAARILRNLIAGLVDLDSSGVENFKPDAIGTKMKAYADEVTGIDTSLVSSSIGAANRLKNFISSLVGLDNTGIANFKPDTIGTAIKNYAGSVSGVNVQAISNSIGAAIKLRNFITSLAGVNTTGVASFKKAVNDLSTVNIAGIVKAFSGASTKLASAGAKMIEGLANGMTSKKAAVERAATSIASSTTDKIESKIAGFTKAGKSMATKLAEGIKSGKKSAESAGSALATAAKDAIRGKYDSFYDAGSYLVTGFKNGISENSYKATAKATAMAEAAIQAARKALKINSPSKVFKEIGSGIPEGFAMGIGMLGSSVDDSVDAMASTAINSARSAMATVLDALNSDMDTQPTIRPVIDLSEVKTGVNAIGGLFASTQSVAVQSNLGAINMAMNRKLQNGANDDVVSAINKLGDGLEANRGDTYNFGNFTYSNNDEINEAVQTLVRAAKMGRRM